MPRSSVSRTLAGALPTASLTRRRVLQVGGVLAGASVVAACGAGESAGGASSAASAAVAADVSDSEKKVAWSNWPLYIPSDDSGTFPTNVSFTESTGVAVDYFEDINDNASFYAKVRTQLEQGRPIDRDLVILTDWMAALWIQNGYAVPLDKAVMPNAVANLEPKWASVGFDPDRTYTMPWQSGFSGLVANLPLLKEKTGADQLTSVEQIFDPALKGRVTVLSEMRDTMAVLIGYQGGDPSNFTDDQFYSAIDLLTQQIDSGQIRQVSGVDYTAAFESGDAIAGIGWNGIHVLGDDYSFTLPETGGGLWSDNFLIPAGAIHKKNAELVINHYYDPEVAAQVSAWVQYISPVKGTEAAMESVDPSLVGNPNIFPTEADLEKAFVFMELTPEKGEEYTRAFEKAIGN
jgi:spermidine/putrescine transport system substrate-binding protein